MPLKAWVGSRTWLCLEPQQLALFKLRTDQERQRQGIAGIPWKPRFRPACLKASVRVVTAPNFLCADYGPFVEPLTIDPAITSENLDHRQLPCWPAKTPVGPQKDRHLVGTTAA